MPSGGQMLMAMGVYMGLPIVAATTLVGSAGYLIGSHQSSPPKADQLEQGHVQPRDLEFRLTDIDGDGKQESTVLYKGTSYLLQEVDNKLRVASYEIRPAQLDVHGGE